ncbi:hypothetical protein B0T22DRAFT_466516 [Podospora appendiculata]|uniref:Uncharacterized protein n=1 Tax=Podospora appendiculata TaxID=314037 RepID=A0AAE0X6M4_9PEZI|nr:hypothetical protein B0T22DRAFT_466516 [Podospora appendiculata]
MSSARSDLTSINQLPNGTLQPGSWLKEHLQVWVSPLENVMSKAIKRGSKVWFPTERRNSRPRYLYLKIGDEPIVHGQNRVVRLEIHPNPSGDHPSIFMILTESGILNISAMNSKRRFAEGSPFNSERDLISVAHTASSGIP